MFLGDYSFIILVISFRINQGSFSVVASSLSQSSQVQMGSSKVLHRVCHCSFRVF